MWQFSPRNPSKSLFYFRHGMMRLLQLHKASMQKQNDEQSQYFQQKAERAQERRRTRVAKIQRRAKLRRDKLASGFERSSKIIEMLADKATRTLHSSNGEIRVWVPDGKATSRAMAVGSSLDEFVETRASYRARLIKSDRLSVIRRAAIGRLLPRRMSSESAQRSGVLAVRGASRLDAIAPQFVHAITALLVKPANLITVFCGQGPAAQLGIRQRTCQKRRLVWPCLRGQVCQILLEERRTATRLSAVMQVFAGPWLPVPKPAPYRT